MAAASYAVQVRAAAEPQKITPALIEAAKKEGKLSWYTSVDLPVAEKIAKAFEAAYPGVSMKVERSGAERIFQRIGQEYAEQDLQLRRREQLRRRAPDHLEARLDAGLLPAGGGRQVFPKEHWDPDGMYASWRVTLSPIAYNTKLVKAEDAPKGFTDLLDAQMVGQDRQGASGLQRHHHDRDPAAQPRSRLVLFREARQAEGHAGPVGRRSAEEGLARRARHHGRRQRVHGEPAAVARRADRGGLCRRRHAADHRPVGRHGPCAPIPTRRGCSMPGR